MKTLTAVLLCSLSLPLAADEIAAPEHAFDRLHDLGAFLLELGGAHLCPVHL